MMITREYDATNINAVLNNPSVRPWVADVSEGVIDISAKIADKNNVLLMAEFGGIVFLSYGKGSGIYECHTQVLPEARGKWTMTLAHGCAQYMFTHTDCVEILTRVPDGHIGAKATTMGAGMRYEFTRSRECKFRGEVRDVHIYSMAVKEWIAAAPSIEDRGRWFHDRLHQEAVRLGIAAPPHENDPQHNRIVGACFEMALGGQTLKGVSVYNRWAIASRHAPIVFLSNSPPTIRFDIGILEVTEGDIRVTKDAA